MSCLILTYRDVYFSSGVAGQLGGDIEGGGVVDVQGALSPLKNPDEGSPKVTRGRGSGNDYLF